MKNLPKASDILKLRVESYDGINGIKKYYIPRLAYSGENDFDTKEDAEKWIETLDKAPLLEEENKRLRETLHESKLQIEYLQDKFQETGSGNAIISKINQIL